MVEDSATVLQAGERSSRADEERWPSSAEKALPPPSSEMVLDKASRILGRKLAHQSGDVIDIEKVPPGLIVDDLASRRSSDPTQKDQI
jgi:hypothetical protein